MSLDGLEKTILDEKPKDARNYNSLVCKGAVPVTPLIPKLITSDLQYSIISKLTA